MANGHPVSQVVEGRNGTGHGVSNIIPAMRFSWEISNVDSVFTNGLARVNDLSKEAMLQAIKDKDLRFLAVSYKELLSNTFAGEEIEGLSLLSIPLSIYCQS